MGTEWKEVVGKRILYSHGWGIREGKVEEISPSEIYIKISGSWVSIYKIELKEVLS